MDRENYLKVVDRLGYGRIYNFSRGTCEDFACDTRIDIDNSEGKATEVLERIVAYVDALLYDADRYEPMETTDVLDFVVEDERYTLDLDEMIHDADEAEWEEWKSLRKKLLNAKKACVEYWYSYDTICAEDLVDHGLKLMLEDLLAEGRLADCVTMQMKVLAVAMRIQGCRYLWINGMHNGRYVCGELPFEQNEALLRNCGGWCQMDDDDEGGVFLRLHPKTSQALLNRVREVGKTLSQKIDCEVKLMLSYEDFRNDYMELHAALEDTIVSCVDKAEDDKQQRNFPDLRIYFTPEEKQALLDRYPTLSRKFVQYANSSYTEDDLERIRFLWTLVLMESYEGPKTLDIQYALPKPTDEFWKIFYALPEEIRLKLYGFCDYENKILSSGKEIIVRPEVIDDGFFGKHSGIGDFSIMDDELLASMRWYGYYLHVNMIHLKDIDDVHLLCDFMNELKEIERLAQAETGEPICNPKRDERYDGSLLSKWQGSVNRLNTSAEKEKIPEMTMREFHEQASKAEPEDMNHIIMYTDDLTFAPDADGQWARLRFRLEDDKYIYEIAQADV